ncbi:MAG: hypothetical protein U9Q84_01345 [Thermodesulfobacteriota bacterium]|nr:hypothetical protein [Thermodesulfobacteriota bacterium]
MNEAYQNFKSWYVHVLEGLYEDRDAGFAILMISIPLLERYLREKRGSYERNLNDTFYDQMQKKFSELTSQELCKQFWQVYRNGLLHQVTISKRNMKGIKMPVGWLSHDVPMLKIDKDGSFGVHPVKFSRRIICIIENDFSTFFGEHSKNHPLPVEHQTMSMLGTSVPGSLDGKG